MRKGQLAIQLESSNTNDLILMLPIVASCITLIPCGMLYAAFAMAVGTGSWLGGTIFMFSFVLTQTFFMQLGISVGHLFGNNFKNFFNTSFPWLCILIGLIYIFIFISKIKPI